MTDVKEQIVKALGELVVGGVVIKVHPSYEDYYKQRYTQMMDKDLILVCDKGEYNLEKNPYGRHGLVGTTQVLAELKKLQRLFPRDGVFEMSAMRLDDMAKQAEETGQPVVTATQSGAVTGKPLEFIKVDFMLPAVKCECGGDACNTTHSDWCPKYG
jgi:hypothetical protein